MPAAPLARGWEFLFRLACAEKRGDDYQEFFWQIMERRDVEFKRVRPWGNVGDRKNDGWSPALRMLFQCYAPVGFRASDLAAKLNEDYEGAVDYWEDFFDTWVFVHNDVAGMGPEVARKVAELDQRSAHICCTSWGHPELRDQFAQLDEEHRTAILGPPLTQYDFMSVDAAKLRPLIEALGEMTPVPASEIKPVPADKIEANDLLPAQIDYLTLGSTRAPLVEHYLTDAYALPSRADGIAQVVSNRYVQLRDDGHAPKDIFDLLLAWITGGKGGSTDTTVSALAVLAYFFDRCHIFEVAGERGA